MDKKNIFGNIVELGYFNKPYFPNLAVNTRDGKVFLPTESPVNLPLIGLADCIDESRVENREIIHTVRLTANLRSLPDGIEGTGCTFVFRTADGRRYFIGGCDRPYPVVTAQENFPGTFSSPSGFTLNIEYQNTHGVLLVC